MHGRCTVWQIALLYMLSRLVVNVTGTYWPFYVLKTLGLPKVQCSTLILLFSSVHHAFAHVIDAVRGIMSSGCPSVCACGAFSVDF